MAIIGTADLGIGDISPDAYIRIVKVEYHPDALSYNSDGTTYTTPEIEVFIATYHNKACRELEIVKGFVADYLEAHKDTIDPKKALWLQNNIMGRSARPLQEYSWATKNLSLFEGLNFAIVPQEVFVPYMYGWIKKHPILGVVLNMRDDDDIEDKVNSSFVKQHPEIFGG